MAWVNLSQTVYPIGSVYMSTISTSPASTIGGTWSQKTGGCVACAGTSGYASANATGGSNTITEEQMPSHSHGMDVWANETSEVTVPAWQLYIGDRWANTGAVRSNGESSSMGRRGATGFGPTSSTGGGQDFIPAHVSFYVWVRTA